MIIFKKICKWWRIRRW